jgi:hypothetical protein
MKKTTLISGVVSSIIVLIGVLFKIMHWPGASVVLLIGIVIFAAVYSLSLFIDKQKLASTKTQKISNVFVMLAMVLISVGFLFKILHWPGAGIVIYLSNAALLVLIPIIFIKASKETETVKKLNFYIESIVIVLLLAFSIFLLFI